MKLTYLEFNQELWDLLKNPNFLLYFQDLIEANKVMNLTNIVEEKAVYEKHFYDSIILSKALDIKNKSILDIGAGAGFPSLPLKLIEPSLEVTIIDSLYKRINFLYEISRIFKLDKLELIHGRAEEMNKNTLYDLVTARAVARLNILAELALPFVKIGGYFIAYKSLSYETELTEALNAIRLLGGEVEEIIEYEINEELHHILILIKKNKPTPSIYPRIFGKIKKSPL
jgi:16S rRNA (guanine527-N7)-methyltransferase